MQLVKMVVLSVDECVGRSVYVSPYNDCCQ